MYDNNFLGKNNFIWFNGVVEDRQDPQKLGRLRVRCIGIHTDNKDELPTADLPWSQLIHPITSSGISGLGHSPGFIVEGTWVFGYFRDGYAMQEPMVIGTLPGKPIELADTSKGFYDPNGVYPKYKDEVDTNRLAVNDSEQPHLGLELRKLTRKTGVPTADFDRVELEDHISTAIEASDGDTFDQPAIPYAAVYPFNHVFESESGHVFEIDDTKDNERLFTSHRTGTSQEISPDGTQVNIIKGDHYNIVSGKRQAVIEGNADLTIGGRHKIYINKDGQTDNHYDIQIGQNASVNIQIDKGDMNVVLKDGKMNTNVAGDYNMKVGGDYNLDIRGNKVETVSKDKTSNTTGNVIHRGKRIDLNP
tara:strand:+ start:6178 stop:7263 length:1086 start_codon:yes stop_codon:yes gene_type:complete